MTQDSEEFELHGPDDDGWHYTVLMDWIVLNEDITNTAYRLYVIMRSLCSEKAAPVRRLRREELRLLLPGVNGKECKLTALKDAISCLERNGLVERLDPAVSGGIPRWKVCNMPKHPEKYTGWRNARDKLDHIRTPEDPAGIPAGSDTRPEKRPGAGKTTGGAGKTTGAGRNSVADTGGDQPKPGTQVRDQVRGSNTGSQQDSSSGDVPPPPDAEEPDCLPGEEPQKDEYGTGRRLLREASVTWPKPLGGHAVEKFAPLVTELAAEHGDARTLNRLVQLGTEGDPRNPAGQLYKALEDVAASRDARRDAPQDQQQPEEFISDVRRFRDEHGDVELYRLSKTHVLVVRDREEKRLLSSMGIIQNVKIRSVRAVA